MPLDVLLGIVAGCMHLVGFFIYNQQAKLGTSRPNLVTWGLWVFLTVMNLVSYSVMSGDIIKALLPLASSIACLITFGLILVRGQFSIASLSKSDSAAFALGFLASIVWIWFKSAASANVILIGAVGISFLPTIRGVWMNPKNEKALPWFIWSAAYIFLFITIAMRWRGQYEDLVYPIGGLIMHALVGFLAKRGIVVQSSEGGIYA